MMKYLKILSFVLVLFFMIGCEESNPSYTTEEIIESIEIGYQESDNQNHVTKSLNFPLESSLDSNIKISWISDQPSVIDYFGTVNRPDDDTVVDVTFTVDNYGSKFSQVLSFTVIGKNQVIETTYTINYYLQNLENDEYTLSDSKVILSEVGDNIVINPVNQTGYTLNTNVSILTGKVIENGDLTLDIYYDRNVYQVELLDGSTVIDTLSVKHGDVIALDNPEKDDFDFVEWRKEGSTAPFDFDQVITSHLVLNAIFKAKDDPYVYTGYYQGADGLYGLDLISFLNNLISDYKYYSYDAARYILDETDADPNNSNNVILVYSGESISNEWDCAGGTCVWNREHVWPQSLLDYDTTMSSDIHNLKPSDPSYNSSRGNKYFGNETTPQTYEPRDEVKGDIARILFYMDIMYDELSLINANEGTTYEMGKLEVLLEWHGLDPVDDFERNRNEVIYSYQNNRNPFIDHPEFVDKIYDDNTSQTSLEIPHGILEHMILEQNRV
ncbi:MAG: endonuclease [Acholeplasmataceae bacterium]